MNHLPGALGLFVLLLCAGCGAPPLTVVAFESPGTALSFESDDGTDARVTFPGKLELAQFATEGDEDRFPVKGTLRVNQLVEEEKIPSRMRGLLIEGEGGVDIRVKGSYSVYERDGAEESPETFAVKIRGKQLLSVLNGEEVKVRVGDPLAFELILGLDQPKD